VFAVHHAIADSVNDQHDNEFWMAVGRLAEKCRLTRRTAGLAMATLVAEGYVDITDGDPVNAARPVRYRFLFPESPVVFEGRRVRDPRNLVRSNHAPGAQSTTPEVRTDNAPIEPNREPKLKTQAENGQFDAFWMAYPRKVAKGDARKAYAKAIQTADPEIITLGAHRLANDPNRVDKFTPHPATWLNGERWNDPPLPSTLSPVRSGPSQNGITGAGPRTITVTRPAKRDPRG